jgi:NTE family protein
MKKTALVLQGGGALGAYQYGAIKYFQEKLADFQPVIVTGVSIGAINAAVMLGGKYGVVESLNILWNTIKIAPIPFMPQSWQAKVSKWGNPNMYYINPEYVYSPLTAQSVYDLTPFHQLLGNLIDFDKLNNHPTQIVVEAVNVESGELERFSNRTHQITLPHIIASMSIPPNFPAIHIGENFYWDGGLYANMPLAPAINFLEEISGDEVLRELIIINLFRRQDKLPTNISDISDRIKELMFESKLALDQKTFAKMNDYIDMIKQIDAELPPNSPVKQNPTYQKLIHHQKINEVKVLQYEAEGVEGTDDFTPESIDFRIRTGYRDAENAMKSV